MKTFEILTSSLAECLNSAIEQLLVVPKFAAKYNDDSLLRWLRQDVGKLESATCVSDALEQLVSTFFVPYCLDQKAHPGTLLIVMWRELCVGSLKAEKLSGSFVEQQINSEIYSIASSLIADQSSANGKTTIETPGGSANLEYFRTDHGWDYTVTSTEGIVYGFPEQLCIATQEVPGGLFAQQVSIYDMLIEPREYQLQPYEEFGALHLGNGQLWWPNPSGS